MITHRCGTTMPADIETYVRHLATCPQTHGTTGGVCQGIVTAVEYEASRGRPRPVAPLGDPSRNRPLVSRASAQSRVRHICTVCGAAFYPPRVDAQYCSGACRQKAYRERKRRERYG